MELKDSKGKIVATVTAHDGSGGPVDEGVWVEVQAGDGTRPTICLINSTDVAGTDWYVGFYRDAKARDIKGCDFAVALTEHGPTLQVIKDGQIRIVDLFDLAGHLESHCKRDV